jgi:hypothetical protein
MGAYKTYADEAIAVMNFFNSFINSFEDKEGTYTEFFNAYIANLEASIPDAPTEEKQTDPLPKKKRTTEKKPSTKEDSSTDETTEAPKTKRPPTFYNLFLKEHIRNFANLPSKERMGAVGKFWRESEKGKFYKTTCDELKKEDPTVSNEDIYEKVRAMYEGTMPDTKETEDTTTIDTDNEDNEDDEEITSFFNFPTEK